MRNITLKLVRECREIASGEKMAYIRKWLSFPLWYEDRRKIGKFIQI